jgi:hypothetical protein
MAFVGRGARRPAHLAALAMTGVFVAAACGKQRTDADSTAAARTSQTAGVPRSNDGPCPRTGHWTVCQVHDRIDRAGLAPYDSVASAELPALGPAPTVYRVNKAALVIYLFADSVARVKAARSLDTTRFVSSSLPLTVLTAATVIQNDNLLALLYSKNDHQRERVSDALTAGPPQR